MHCGRLSDLRLTMDSNGSPQQPPRPRSNSRLFCGCTLLIGAFIMVFYSSPSSEVVLFLTNITTQPRRLKNVTDTKGVRNLTGDAFQLQMDINSTEPLKGLILLWGFTYVTETLKFTESEMKHFDCGAYQCDITRNRSLLPKSHIILFNPRYTHSRGLLPPTRQPWQRWVLRTGESPMYDNMRLYDGRANWTLTYHRKSDITWYWGHTIPHGRYDLLPVHVPSLKYSVGKKYLELLNSTETKLKTGYRDLIKDKRKQTLWIVSNCGHQERNRYALDLQRQGIVLDKFGACGKRIKCRGECARKMYSEYKFYLAFENSHCEDYITEKLWKSLSFGMLPIVMGPPVKNYEELLPPDSFLHVQNFSSPQSLAKYIQYLDKNDEAYLRYHAWRSKYEVVTASKNPAVSNLWICEVCKRIHDPPQPALKGIGAWWTPKAQCNKN